MRSKAVAILCSGVEHNGTIEQEEGEGREEKG
jgi:hypothetical protein